MRPRACPESEYMNKALPKIEIELRTGTFRCVMTTAVSFPRIAIAVCPEPEMALNAYSRLQSMYTRRSQMLRLTNLVQATFRREYCKIPIR